MIANPKKFHALFVKKDQTNTCGINLDFQGHSIKSEETVKLLGVTLDYKLNFDPHISNLCKKAAAQLNVLKRLINLLKNKFWFKVLCIQISTIVVWFDTFSSSKSLQKIEKIQERTLRFLYNDHKSSYDDLLIRSKKCTMQVARQRTLCIKIFKTIKNLNPSLMQSIFSSRTSKHPSRNPNNLNHFRTNQVTFGSKSLKAIGPQIWNCSPNEIKSADNLNSFKCMIKQWDGPSSKCNACKYDHTL